MTETYSTTAAVVRKADAPFELEPVVLGPLRPDELLVRIVGVGMCHTDLQVREPMQAQVLLPAIVGHEGAGVVEAVGSAVTAASIGDHVILSFDYCAVCQNCLDGSPAYCLEFFARNAGRRPDGSASATSAAGEPLANRFFAQSSFAQHCVATDRNIVVIPDDAPLELLGPLGCGLMTGAGTVFNEMGLRPGQRIAIFGAGAVGLSAAMAAVIAGAGEIVVVDLNAGRLQMALELGSTRVVEGGTADLASEVLAGGPGFDFTFDTTGVGAVMLAAVESLAVPGKCVLVAGTQPFSVPPMLLAGRTVTFAIEGSSVPRVLIPQLVDYWRRGRFPIEKLIRTYALADINQAEADSVSGDTIKPVLIPERPNEPIRTS